MSLERHEAETADTETKNTLSYAADESKLNVEEKQESYSKLEESGSEKLGLGEATQEGVVDQQKKTAIIHDFCLGIPFGKSSQFDNLSLRRLNCSVIIFFTLVLVNGDTSLTSLSLFANNNNQRISHRVGLVTWIR